MLQHFMYTMELLQKFKDYWRSVSAVLPGKHHRLLLAISGGADSAVLLHLVANSSIPFEMAHCNFQLRGEESERDQEFVESLAQKYGKQCLLARFQTKEYAEEKKCSIQEAARELRYQWFATLTAEMDQQSTTGNTFIATAHHANDNIETVLMQFFRGTGIQGLTGIRPVWEEKKLVRPLLSFRKQELLNYANEQGLTFVEDSSNASDKYTRNFFRNRLIPQISEVYPAVEENILHNIDRFTEVAHIYEQAIQLQLKKMLVQKGNEWQIPLLKWKKLQPLQSYTHEILSPFGFTAAQVPEAIKLLDAGNSSYLSSHTHRLIKNRNWMIIAPLATTAAENIPVTETDRQVDFAGGHLFIEKLNAVPANISSNNAEAWVDAAAFQFPLLLRRYKTGDYFYPLGMKKKKKLSRFMGDLKLSKTAKEKIWIIESDGKIIWVLGYRIDDRCRITGKTKEIIRFRYADNSSLLS